MSSLRAHWKVLLTVTEISFRDLETAGFSPGDEALNMNSR
jgi:hypothetical protein